MERLESRSLGEAFGGYPDDGRGIAVRVEPAEGNPLAHDLSGVGVGGWLAGRGERGWRHTGER